MTNARCEEIVRRRASSSPSSRARARGSNVRNRLAIYADGLLRRGGRRVDEPVYVARTRVRRAGRGARARTDERRPAVEGGRRRDRENRAWTTRRARRTTMGLGGSTGIKKSVRGEGVGAGRRRTREVASVARGGHRVRAHRRGPAFGARVRSGGGQARSQTSARSLASLEGCRLMSRHGRRSWCLGGKVRREGSSARGWGRLGARTSRPPRTRAWWLSLDSNRPVARFQVIPCRPRAGRCARLRLPLRSPDDARDLPRHHRGAKFRLAHIRISNRFTRKKSPRPAFSARVSFGSARSGGTVRDSRSPISGASDCLLIQMVLAPSEPSNEGLFRWD